MTPDERRAILAIVDRHYASLEPEEQPLRLQDEADEWSDSTLARFLIEWLDDLTLGYQASLASHGFGDRVAELEAQRATIERAAAVARGLTEGVIREAADRVRRRLDRTPTRARVAEELHTTESTLKRAYRELGMGKWPPAPPD